MPTNTVLNNTADDPIKQQDAVGNEKTTRKVRLLELRTNTSPEERVAFGIALDKLREIFGQLANHKDKMELCRDLETLAEKAKQKPLSEIPMLKLPEPNDGTYAKYNDYISECQRHKVPRKQRMSGEEFLYLHWDKYIETRCLTLDDLRKRDAALVNRLYHEGQRVGKTAADYLLADNNNVKDQELEEYGLEALKRFERLGRAARRRGLIQPNSSEPA